MKTYEKSRMYTLTGELTELDTEVIKYLVFIEYSSKTSFRALDFQKII